MSLQRRDGLVREMSGVCVYVCVSMRTCVCVKYHIMQRRDGLVRKMSGVCVCVCVLAHMCVSSVTPAQGWLVREMSGVCVCVCVCSCAHVCVCVCVSSITSCSAGMA